MSTTLPNEHWPIKRIPISIRLRLWTGKIKNPNISHEILAVRIMLNMFNNPFTSTIPPIFNRRYVEKGIVEMTSRVPESEYLEFGD